MKIEDIIVGNKYVLKKGESSGSIYWHEDMNSLDGAVVTVSSRGLGGVTINDGAWFVNPAWLSPIASQTALDRAMDAIDGRSGVLPSGFECEPLPQPLPAQIYEINERGIFGSIVSDGSGWHYSLEVEEKCDGEEDILALVERVNWAYERLQMVANFLTPMNPS